MIGINVNLGPLQALQLQVAARTDPPDRKNGDMRARDAQSAKDQIQNDGRLAFPPALNAKEAKPDHATFMAKVEAIFQANQALAPGADLTTDAARLQALQVRQQLEAQSYGITNRATELALALFR